MYISHSVMDGQRHLLLFTKCVAQFLSDIAEFLVEAIECRTQIR